MFASYEGILASYETVLSHVISCEVFAFLQPFLGSAQFVRAIVESVQSVLHFESGWQWPRR